MNGYRSMLELLKCMQCMDSVTRQTGQHIEYEPEWDGAFNLQLKLADDIAEILDWCSTDVCPNHFSYFFSSQCLALNNPEYKLM